MADEVAGKKAQYTVMEQIGRGSYGTVRRIQRKSDGKMLVWKELDYSQMSEKEKQLLVAEVNILREIRSPYVVKYYDRILDRANTTLYIIMEYCEGGDLSAMVKRHRRNGTHFEEEAVWRVLAQLLWAINDCHNHPKGKILHRDLKPANVFVDPKRSDIKIGDFGLARVMGEKTQFATTNVGTPYYMSPEQVNDEGYNHKCDVWAIGCIAYELCALAPPFEAQTHIALALKIKKGSFARIPQIYSNDLQRVISCMLTTNPHKRAGVQDMLSHRQIQLRYRELKVNASYRAHKQREEELREWERKLREKESKLAAREKALGSAEKMSPDPMLVSPFNPVKENVQPNTAATKAVANQPKPAQERQSTRTRVTAPPA